MRGMRLRSNVSRRLMLRVAQATRVLRKSRPEVRKFGGFLELASARALRLPSVASRVFRTEVRIEFPERRSVPEWFRVRVRRCERWRYRVHIVRRCAECME